MFVYKHQIAVFGRHSYYGAARKKPFKKTLKNGGNSLIFATFCG
jgi:hypothetical protein